MHYSCSICCELFILTSHVSVVQCGHVYHSSCVSEWLKDHNTCPQCRAKLRGQPQRIYFNIDDGDGDDDPSTLRYKIQQLSFKLEEEKKLRILNEKERIKAEEISAELRKRVLDLEFVAQTQEATIRENRERDKQFELIKKELVEKKSACNELKEIETVLRGSKESVRLLLARTPKNPQSFRNICTYVEVLKKQLEDKNKCLKEEKLRCRAMMQEVTTLKRRMSSDRQSLGDSKPQKLKRTCELYPTNLGARPKEPRLSWTASLGEGTSRSEAQASVTSVIAREPLKDVPVASSSNGITNGAASSRPKSSTIEDVIRPKQISGSRSLLLKTKSSTSTTIFTGMGGSSKPSLAAPMSPTELIRMRLQRFK